MTHKKTSWFVLHSPELGRDFESFYQLCNEDGVLDKKTKELLMLVLTSVSRYPIKAEEHLIHALEVGVTKEEITEVLSIAAAEGARAQLILERELCLKYFGTTEKK